MRKLVLVLLLGGCATTAMPSGPVGAQIKQDQQVCLDRGALAEGREVQFRRQVCRAANPKTTHQICSLQSVGSGRALRVVDDRCATVQLAANTVLQPGDLVETQ